MSSKANSYGWSPVPRSLDKFVAQTSPTASQPFPISKIPYPTDPISKKTLDYVTQKLRPETLNHSLRVFAYAYAISTQHFPHFLDEEQYPEFVRTLYLTCLLHDIGTAEENLLTTKMSFDFYGALVGMRFLEGVGAEKDMVHAVGEAVIRHQDLGETGTITVVGACVQLVTVLDNTGMYPKLVHEETIDAVTREWPRKKWSSCFGATIRKEVGAKPWCHSTHIEGFSEKVEGNSVMEKWD